MTASTLQNIRCLRCTSIALQLAVRIDPHTPPRSRCARNPVFCEGRLPRLTPRKEWKTHGEGTKLRICCCDVGLRKVTPNGCLRVGPQLTFQPSGNVNHTTKYEGECSSCEDQEYTEDDEERPRSRTTITSVSVGGSGHSIERKENPLNSSPSTSIRTPIAESGPQ